MRRARAGLAVASVSAVAMLAAACGGGGGGGTAQGTSSGGAKGGTLYVLYNKPLEHIDPQRAYVSNILNWGTRLVYRTLTTYKSQPGKAGSEIVPDLATDLGTNTDGGKTWAFTLKDGVKFEDGKDITCADIKYGVSRTFATDIITDGPLYAIDYLDIPTGADGTSVYKGPYKADAAGQAAFDKAITCDGKKITFHLKKAVNDFNQTISMPAWSPVPKSADTGEKYDQKVVASGPYKIQSYDGQKGYTLVRNTFWDPKTDTVRKAYPDQIVGTYGLDPSVIDQRLLADTGNDKFAISGDAEVQPEDVSRVLSDPSLHNRQVQGLDGFGLYLAINTKKVTNLNVRKAIGLAFNKVSFRTAQGGETAGDYASSIITPALGASYKKFDAFGISNPEGDPQKAKAALQAAAAEGVKLPISLTMDYRQNPVNDKAAAAIKEAEARAGIIITLNPIATGYYATIGDPAKQHDLSTGGWAPDWTNGSTVIPPLFDGSQLSKTNSGSNYSQLNDPQVNQAIADALATKDPAAQAKKWGDIDEMVVNVKAAAVPTMYSKAFQIYGSGVKGYYLHSYFGDKDMATLAVK